MRIILSNAATGKHNVGVAYAPILKTVGGGGTGVSGLTRSFGDPPPKVNPGAFSGQRQG